VILYLKRRPNMDWNVTVNGKEIKMSNEEYEEMLEVNLSDRFKSRFNEPVYSNTYDNGGWPERDALPTGDPHGDVDEPKDKPTVLKLKTGVYSVKIPDNDSWAVNPWDELGVPFEQYKKDMEKYINTMKNRLLVPKGKMVEVCGKASSGESVFQKTCCSNPDKYKNVISNNLKFYSCRNCGADLGDC
jgi:hypothetical protein